MTDAPPTIIDRLEQEWRRLARSGVVDQALEGWKACDARLSFETAGHLADHLASRSVDPARRSEVLGALVELAHDDEVAAQLVLVAFVPLLKTLCRHHEPLGIDEWASVLVAVAYEVISTYPAGSRPAFLADRLAREIRRRARRVLARQRRAYGETALADDGVVALIDAQVRPPESDAVDLDDFLDWALRRRVIDRDSLGLVWETRVEGSTVAAVAGATRTCADTLRQRRWRAERRLAVAFGAVA